MLWCSIVNYGIFSVYLQIVSFTIMCVFIKGKKKRKKLIFMRSIKIRYDFSVIEILHFFHNILNLFLSLVGIKKM